MDLWELCSDNDEKYFAHLPDDVTKALVGTGVSPVGMRAALDAASIRELRFQLLDTLSQEVIRTGPQTLSDRLAWSWVPIFSARARHTAIDLGCERNEFWPCRFESNPNDPFFMHLPDRQFDIVDFERSRFRNVIPTTPPLLHNLETLVLKDSPAQLPPFFRVPMLGHSQVLSELLVTEALKLAWETHGFTGGFFRRLTGSPKPNETMPLAGEGEFSSVAQLMRADEAGWLSDRRFDETLWRLLLQHIESPADAAYFGHAVLVYFASKLMEAEVMNGGFAQAAYNIPEWFEPAASAYRHLGLDKAASLIDEAALLMHQGERRGERFIALDDSKSGANFTEDLARLGQQFSDSDLDALNGKLEATGFLAAYRRLHHVRDHRDVFSAIELR